MLNEKPKVMITSLSAKDRILEVAGSLFMLRGYELVGVNEIIEKADVAKATFYNNFKSKELLCQVWLRSVWNASELNNVKIQNADGDLSSKIEMKFRMLEENLIEHSYRGCPFSNTKVMLPNSVVITQLIVDYKEYSRQFWRKLVSSAGKPEELGDILFLIYSGATTEAQNAFDLWPVKSALSASLTMTQGDL